MLAGFARYQVRRQRRGDSPLVEPSIFRHRPYTAGIVFSIVFVGSMGGIVMLFNVFLQNGLGFTPWHSAITTAPWAAGAFIGSAAGGIAMSKLGGRVLHAGLVVEAAGLLAMYAVLRGVGGGASTADLLAPMIIGGIGMGMVFVPLFDIVMAGVRPREMGSASGVLQTVNALGMSVGIAGIGAIFFALTAVGGSHVATYLNAAEWTALATVGLLACSFGSGVLAAEVSQGGGRAGRSAAGRPVIHRIQATGSGATGHWTEDVREEATNHERNHLDRMGHPGRGPGDAADGGRRGARGRLAAADPLREVDRHPGPAARRAGPAGVGCRGDGDRDAR